MFRKKFLTKRPQALAARAERIRRLDMVNRLLADQQAPLSPFAPLFDDFLDLDDDFYDDDDFEWAALH